MSLLYEIFGWAGAIAFAFCALPQALQCLRQKHAHGVNALFLTLWITGEILTLTYVIGDIGFKWPLLVNYIMNIIFIAVIVYFKLFPKYPAYNS